MSNELIKIDKQVYTIPQLKSINIIGDPGCDGLGAEIMGIFAKAMTCAKADLSMIIGDIVPYGSKRIYDNVSRFINSLATHPVYPLCGNHDTDFYEEFFGLRNYCLVSDELLLIVLDNSARKFSEETLKFFKSTLEQNHRKNIVILFHIPPYCDSVTNFVNPPEWEPLRQIYLPYLDSIKYFISGHVHSLAFDQIDGIPIIITGGGGARIEPLREDGNNGDGENSTPAKHHIINISFDKDNRLTHKIIYLDESHYDKELADTVLKKSLDTSFNNEVMAHFKYKLLSERAKDEGFTELSKLFSALSSSEFHHAKNHFHVLDKGTDLLDEIGNSIKNETWEVETMYREYKEYAEKEGHSLASYTFNDAHRAEMVHKELLQSALNIVKKGEDIPKTSYYTCSSCGYTFETEDAPERCPVCGAPADKIIQEC